MTWHGLRIQCAADGIDDRLPLVTDRMKEANHVKTRSTFAPISAIGLALTVVTGCALDPSEASEESISEDKALAVVPAGRVNIYSFLNGNWQARQFTLAGPTLASTASFSFGVASDIPLVGPDSNGSGSDTIGSYGTTTAGDRRGRFFFDNDGSRSWGPGDSDSKFMTTPQAGDQPFVTKGQLWGRNGSGVCAPRTTGGTGGTFSFPVSGRMVGIKRGTTIYWDRDGNGTWGGTNHCDLSGTFGNSTDIPVGVNDLVGTTRVSGSTREWFVDANKNLFWDGLDFSITNFGATTDFVPASHPYAFNVQRGTAVYFDLNGNYVWDNAGDREFLNAIPSSTWRLAGVAYQ